MTNTILAIVFIEHQSSQALISIFLLKKKVIVSKVFVVFFGEVSTMTKAQQGPTSLLFWRDTQYKDVYYCFLKRNVLLFFYYKLYFWFVRQCDPISYDLLFPPSSDYTDNGPIKCPICGKYFEDIVTAELVHGTSSEPDQIDDDSHVHVEAQVRYIL